jgi:hypothetical protein
LQEEGVSRPLEKTCAGIIDKMMTEPILSFLPAGSMTCWAKLLSLVIKEGGVRVSAIDVVERKEKDEMTLAWSYCSWVERLRSALELMLG